MKHSTMMHAAVEDDEPPLLGEEAETEGAEDNNQTQRQEDDQSLMDEMMAIAQQARDTKRQEQEKTRRSKTFGQGLTKGFFNSKPKQKPRSIPTRDDLLIVKPSADASKDTKASNNAESSAFVFPEVQDALKNMNQLNPKEWMNEKFFAKLARNPKLAQALQNPRFTQAIDEMQRDPKAAILKYQKDEAVSTMLKDFMEFLGGHFEELGKEMENNAPPVQQAAPAPAQPAIVDLNQVRRDAVQSMARSPEEEVQVQRILQNPALLEALSDAALMDRIRQCQQQPQELQRLMQDPKLGPKLRLLMDAQLVRFA